MAEILQFNKIDYLSPLPVIGKRGRILPCMENFRAMFDRVGITCRYNVISKEPEIVIPGVTPQKDNQLNVALTHIGSYAERFGIGSAQAMKFTLAIADENPFNPAALWILSQPWDGVDRLPQFLDSVQTDPESADMKDMLILKWCLSAIAALTQPDGISAHGVLVFQGKQGLGKTHWFKKLVPIDMGLSQDGMMLNLSDKDSVSQVCSKWLVELGELESTFKKSDISQLKAFITRQTDIIRMPYDPKPSTFPRRTIFFASVNQVDFLHDETGSRRFWAIKCTGVNWNHGLDMQQVWRQIYETMYLKGVPWILTAEQQAMLDSSNQHFESIDPLAEIASEYFNWDADQDAWSWKSITAIAEDMLQRTPTKGEVSRVKASIERLNGGKSKIIRGKKLFFIAPKRLGF